MEGNVGYREEQRKRMVNETEIRIWDLNAGVNDVCQ
jgi:hypothetical protein